MTKDLSKDPQVILRRGKTGTGAFGLYIDLAVFSLATGRLARQERFFLAGKQLCKYSRPRGKKRASWRSFPLTTHGDARDVLLKNLRRYEGSSVMGVQLLHTPLLVELTSVDVDALSKSEAPAARHEGKRAVEKAIGKLDDERVFTFTDPSAPWAEAF